MLAGFFAFIVALNDMGEGASRGGHALGRGSVLRCPSHSLPVCGQTCGHGGLACLRPAGYPGDVLMGLGLGWGLYPMQCTVDADGKPNNCGYGCGSFNSAGNIAGLQALGYNISNTGYCGDGCFMPSNGSESLPWGIVHAKRDDRGD